MSIHECKISTGLNKIIMKHNAREYVDINDSINLNNYNIVNSSRKTT